VSRCRGSGPSSPGLLKVPADQLEGLLTVDGTTGSGDGEVAQMPRQLPAAVAGFTGRAAELAALTQVLDEAGARGPCTVVISAIGGTAGVGKTALAVRWAHQVAHPVPRRAPRPACARCSPGLTGNSAPDQRACSGC
jgi:hypothetical protein